MRDQVRDQMRDQMRDEVRDQMRDQMRDEVRDEMRDILGIKSVLQFSLYFLGIKIMYTSTCISNKSCHRHSYGFQNLMSSWGVAPMKIKILMGIWIF